MQNDQDTPQPQEPSGEQAGGGQSESRPRVEGQSRKQQGEGRGAAEPNARPQQPAEDARQPRDGDDQGNQEFADLLAASERGGPRPEPAPGQQLTGTIVQIGEKEAFISCGGRSDLPIELRELLDEKGELHHKVGDRLTAYVKRDGEELRLTLVHKQRRGRDTRQIEQAAASGLPLEGKVRETNKGGFVVDIGGHRAFCPISQIDNHYVEDPKPYVGLTLKFRVTEFKEGGRNIIVSRRVLLDEEAAAKGAETRRTLKVGDVLEGRVTRLMTFGAFVDIGGVEGLVHVSEISHEHVDTPTAVLKPGQTVRAKVLDIQNLGQGKQERISLSMKALAADPWADLASRFQIGATVPGQVRRLVDYGAFVELMPGVQGLIHISELSHERIRHPREVVQEGMPVTVRILDIDLARKRISLSLRQAEGAGDHGLPAEQPHGNEA